MELLACPAGIALCPGGCPWTGMGQLCRGLGEEWGRLLFHPHTSRLEQGMELGAAILLGVRLLQVPPCPDPSPQLPVPPRMLHSEQSVRQLGSAVPEEEKAAY